MKLELIMRYRKQTKGTVVFEEDQQDSGIKTLYIAKGCGFNDCDVIHVTVEDTELETADAS